MKWVSQTNNRIYDNQIIIGTAEIEVEKEKKLSAKERKMMDKEGELTSDADYARALKGDPNEAQLWIK